MTAITLREQVSFAHSDERFEYVAPAVDDLARDPPPPARCQDLIIGSGPSASVVAWHLARAGREVVLLEEGPKRELADFKGYTPADTFGQMYRALGGFPVIGGPGTPPILLVMARCKGGGTVVNGAVCYRTPDEVIAGWDDHLGLSHLVREIGPAYARVEARIGVTPMTHLHSPAVLKVKAAAERLGWAHHDVQRNTPTCQGAGRCFSGCPNDAKQSMLLTYLKDAEALGARVFTGCRVSKLAGSASSVSAAHGVRHGKPFTVRAERVFLACGAIFTPFLMQKSGVDHLPAVGRHLTIHPSTRAYYVYDEAVNGFDGAVQSFAIHQFRHEGIHIISVFPPPMAVAASLPWLGPALRENMKMLPKIGIMGALISDESEGRVRALPFVDTPIVTYHMRKNDRARLLRVMHLLGELGFAAGAREVFLPFNWRPAVKNKNELDRFLAQKIPTHEIEVTAQHPLGTCRMGYDEERSVVREDGRVHGFDNLHVIDSSVIPTSIGVNPMLTILAVAEVIGGTLAG